MASHRPLGCRARLTGKSPRTTCFPAGRSDHWFGSRTAPSAWIPGSTRGRAAPLVGPDSFFGSSPAARAVQMPSRKATATIGLRCTVSSPISDSRHARTEMQRNGKVDYGADTINEQTGDSDFASEDLRQQSIKAKERKSQSDP